MAKNSKHKIIILIGESACGKDTICAKLIGKNTKRLVTYTTRPPRDNEKDGVDYHFVTKDEFFNLNLIEYREYKTVFGTWYYGSADENINLSKNDYVIVLTPDGAQSFIDHFGVENCIVFYIYVPKKIRTERAMKRPNFNSDEWERRLIADKHDFSDDKVNKVAKFKISNFDTDINNVVKAIKTYVSIWKGN